MTDLKITKEFVDAYNLYGELQHHPAGTGETLKIEVDAYYEQLMADYQPKDRDFE